MEKTEALKMAKAELECLERKTSGKYEDCNSDCDNCALCYEQGTNGQHKEWLKMVIELLEQEDYIKVPKKALKYKGEGIVVYNVEWLKEHFDIERKSILGDSKDCEDAISRADAIDACNQSVNILEATDRIKDLSPVYPKAKVGKWIESHIPESVLSECSECGFSCGALSFNYCPMCGAKMEREVRE